MVNTNKYNTGFTLIELMVAMAIGVFMSLSMVSYLADSMRSAAVLRSEKQISESAQRALSLLSDAANEAGSGNAASSDVPFFVGDCDGWNPCTSNGSSDGPDRMAVMLTPENRRTCGNTLVAENEQIANVFYIDNVSGVDALYCRAYSLLTLNWLEAGSVLVDGVQDLQILYRVDDSDAGLYKYVAADNVPAVDGDSELGWDRVRAVELHLLLNNGQGNTTPDTPDTQSFQLADTAAQSFSDGVLRRAFSTQALIYSKMDQ